ncbi:MAG TPA: MmgE/PrpD family protein [Burkholderiales bacterium]|nr:MmgE/PrpD family protein [Burkholderiales bacterium]
MDANSAQGKSNARGRALVDYIAGARKRRFPPEVVNEAKRALLDILGVSIGANDEAPVAAVRAAAESWNATGNALIFLGRRTTPALAALVNGTMAHAMDYDDSHPNGAGHPSAVCWPTALALAGTPGLNEQTILAAFITGSEVMGKLGGGGMPGVGRTLQRRGFHPTSIFGRVGAAAVASVILDLTESQISSALGVAATTAGGLVGSFGTHGKPFHAGKAGMDGILAAQLAANGFVAASHLYEIDDGLLKAIIQDGQVEVPPLDFESRWEILGNGFKPYASCRATHASIQLARELAPAVKGRKIARVHARVHPHALVTEIDAKTPLEGKFSTRFCIALGLRDYRLVASDFSDAAMADPAVTELLPLIELEAVPGQHNYTAYMDVYLESGERLHAGVERCLGHPDNPLSWEDLKVKFEGLVEPVLGAAKAAELYRGAHDFERPGSLQRLMRMLENGARDFRAAAAPRTLAQQAS